MVAVTGARILFIVGSSESRPFHHRRSPSPWILIGVDKPLRPIPLLLVTFIRGMYLSRFDKAAESDEPCLLKRRVPILRMEAYLALKTHPITHNFIKGSLS